jgi:hypothetical protein
MINAPDYTFFGSGHCIGCPGQADSECGATIQGQADKLRGAGVVRHWVDNARPSRAPQGHAGVAG